MHRFTVTGSGTHSHGVQDKQVFIKLVPGKIIESDLPLHEMFAEKFKLVEPHNPYEEPLRIIHSRAATAAPGGASHTATVVEKAATPVVALGEDVTEEFPDAEGAEVKVFKDGKTYFVTEKDEVYKPLNDKPLTKGKVNKFIASLTGAPVDPEVESDEAE